MSIYNKLVRDKILEIIKANGQKSTHRILEDDEYAAELAARAIRELTTRISQRRSFGD